MIIEQVPDITLRRDLRLHAVSCTPTHVHVVLSWFGKEQVISDVVQPMEQAHIIAAKIKNILAMLLSKHKGTTGNRWFSRGCDCTPIEDREHLNHLLQTYLPDHVKQCGIVKVFDKGNTSQ